MSQWFGFMSGVKNFGLASHRLQEAVKALLWHARDHDFPVFL
jgi:hypothetical protein